MAPRSLLTLTCFSDEAVNVPAPAKENAHGSEKRQRRRPWTGEIKRKILAATKRPRIWAVRDEEPCDVDAENQRAKAAEPKVPEQQATSTPRREGAPVLQSDRSPSDDDAPDAVAVAVDGRRKRKEGLRVGFDLPPQEISAAPPPVQPRFPSGVLGEPPGSFAHSGADMTAAFLMSVIAEKSRGTDSATTQVDGGLVACWTEKKAACSRRLRYLRDYCPFQREEEEEAGDDEDEKSEPETTTPPRPEAEPCHAEEVRLVKTGLPFDNPESEAEFVKAIRSRYLLIDYCPFQQRKKEEEAEYNEDGESEPETTTRTRPEAEPGRAAARPMRTGLPFDSPESEAEFVKAIRLRYLAYYKVKP